MIGRIIESLSWGLTLTTSSLIISTILEFDNKKSMTCVMWSFIYGCIRGYIGKNLVEWLLGV
jgi:hypothetical protein